MLYSPESATANKSASRVELADLPSDPNEHISPISRAANKVAHFLLDKVGDPAELKARQRAANAETRQANEDALLAWEANEETQDDTPERESRARKILAAVGSAGGRALKSAGEFSVGLHVGAKRTFESAVAGAKTIGAEYKADFQDVATELREARENRKSAALARKAERAASRDAKKQERQEAHDERATAKAARREERAYADAYDNAHAENDRFDQAAERQAQKEQALAEREQLRQERAEAAKLRKAARKAIWTQRKSDAIAKVDAFATTAADRIEDGADFTVNAARKAKTGINNAYETSVDTVTAGATATAEFGRGVYEKGKGAAERLMFKVHETRAIGAAALEAAKQTREVLKVENAIAR